MNISDDLLLQFRVSVSDGANAEGLARATNSSQESSASSTDLGGPAYASAEAASTICFPQIENAFAQSRLGVLRNTVSATTEPDDRSDKARNVMERVLATIAQGKPANVGLAMQRYATSQNAAVEDLKADLTCLAYGTDGSHTVPDSPDTASSAPTKSDNQSKPALKSTPPSTSSDPDTSTPASVDAITINTLADLKAYYAEYATDYSALAAYIKANADSDPDACNAATQAFAEKYSKPIIVNAGIDPAYAQTALGNAFNVTDITLPGKGNFQEYRVNLSVIQDYIDDQNFGNRLHSDQKLAQIIYDASWGPGVTDPIPTYDEVQAALNSLEASFQITSHVSAYPENLPDFYQATSDGAGGYWITPSENFSKTITDCKAYLKEWAGYYGGNPGTQPWNQQMAGGGAAQLAAVDAWVWTIESTDNSAWLKTVIKSSEQAFANYQPNSSTFDANLDSLIRSDAAQYGGLKTTISEAKDAIIDPYGSLVDEYMNYTQSVTDVVAALSDYVKASGDGSKVTFQASDFKAKTDAEISQLSGWSLTIPGTAILSSSDWAKELSGNFVATKNADGTTTLKLDLSNLQGMSNGLANYTNGDISVTQYNAWYSGFTSQKDNVQNLSQSIAEKFSKMNTTFDDLVRVMSATISALLESEEKYFQF